jgi:hypothetical protein
MMRKSCWCTFQSWSTAEENPDIDVAGMEGDSDRDDGDESNKDTGNIIQSYIAGSKIIFYGREWDHYNQDSSNAFFVCGEPATVSYQRIMSLYKRYYIDDKRTCRLGHLLRAFPSFLLVRYVL